MTAIDINYTDELLEELNTTKPPNLSFTRDLHDIPDNETAGAIILMDVLEHIEKPEQLLKDLLSLKAVDNETRLIITVPAFQQLFSIHDKNLGHYRRYNLKQLEQLLSPLSLRMENSGYFSTASSRSGICRNSLKKTNQCRVKTVYTTGKAVLLSPGYCAPAFGLNLKLLGILPASELKYPGSPVIVYAGTLHNNTLS